MANRRGKSKITVDGDCSHEIRRCLFLGREAMTKLGSVLKSTDFSVQCTAAKGQYSQGYGLPSGHIWFWELNCEEGRMPKNWCLWSVVLEKTPESPLDSKEIKSINLKGERPWIFTGRTDAKAEASVFWSSDEKSQLTGKVPDAGEDWGQKEEDIRAWHGWMASPMQGTWTWANFGRWWGTGKPGVPQSIGSQRVRHDWVTEQQKQLKPNNLRECMWVCFYIYVLYMLIHIMYII